MSIFLDHFIARISSGMNRAVALFGDGLPTLTVSDRCTTPGVDQIGGHADPLGDSDDKDFSRKLFEAFGTSLDPEALLDR
jgi:hypothetical protein